MALIVKRAKGKPAARSRRHFRVRKAVTGTSVRPRLVVSRSGAPMTAPGSARSTIAGSCERLPMACSIRSSKANLP